MQMTQSNGNDLIHNTIALLLCGGKSTRMGSDKGLMKLKRNDEIFFWFQDRKNFLEFFFPQTFVSLRHEQWHDYSPYIKKNKILFDSQKDVQGPLNAILTAHEILNGKNLFVLACDMLMFEEKMLKKILRKAHEKQQSVACFFKEQQEPLGAFLHAEKIKQIAIDFKKQDPKNKRTSLRHYYQEKFSWLELSVEEKNFFINCNSMKDIPLKLRI